MAKKELKLGDVIEKDGEKVLVASVYQEVALTEEEFEKIREQKMAEIANLEAYIAKTKLDFNIE